jgi:Kef-type K+ transport system membrane component KefB
VLLATTTPAELFRLPIADPVVVFAIATASFVLAPLLFERFRVPGIIGLIVAGALVGPNALGLLERDETIVLLGTVGLLYLMFVAGIEIDLHGFARNRDRSLAFGAATYLIPQALGTGVGIALGYSWASSILLGSMLASHTLVAYPIASRLGVSKNTAVTAAVGGTIITDLVSLLVLAVVAASTEGELNAAFWARLLASLGVFAALVMLGLPRLARWFFRSEEDGETGAYVFVLASLFAASTLAALAGVEPIIGAFLAGLALNRLIPEGSPLGNRIHFFGNALFIPFFLLSVGMLVDVRVFTGGARAWLVMGGMTVAVVVGKWAAARITQRLYGYSPEEGWTMFGLSVPQAAATLAAALIGYRIELFDATVLNGAIMMILVTCTLGPWAVERYGRRLALREELEPYRPRDTPQRILVPVPDTGSAERLLELAFLVRDPGSSEPIRPLTVASPDGSGGAARVAAAEKVLRHAAVYAAGADVPVDPLPRLDRSVAAGIARGMAETRATVVVAAWDGLRSRRSGIMDDALDQLLERTDQLLLAARLKTPLNTTRRVVLVLPPHVDRSRDFYGAVRVVKRVAERLGAPVAALAVGGDPDRYREHLDAVPPELPVTVEAVAGWGALPDALSGTLGADDLVALVSARRGTVAWERELDRLPRRLASLAPENLLVLYPCEAEAPDTEPPARGVADALGAERVAFQLDGATFAEAVERLLRGELADRPGLARRIAAELARTAEEASAEPAPGVVFTAHVTAEVREPLLFLGIAGEGIPVPGASAPARLLFLLLLPPRCAHERLRYLAEVARLVRTEERRERLCRCRTPETLFDWFRPDPAPGALEEEAWPRTAEEAAGVEPARV